MHGLQAYLFKYITVVAIHINLSLMKMTLKGEVGGHALKSHGNYIVDHGKIMELCFWISVGTLISYFYLIRLMNVELDVASETGDGDMARSVEQCDCPAGHTGTSCEVGSVKDAQHAWFILGRGIGGFSKFLKMIPPNF